MGSGSWTTASFVNYATTRGYDTDSQQTILIRKCLNQKNLIHHSILKML